MITQKDFFCQSSDDKIAYTTGWLLDTFDFLTRVDASRLAIGGTDTEIYIAATSSTITIYHVKTGTTTALSSTSTSVATLYTYNILSFDYCDMGWIRGASYPNFIFLTLDNGSRAVAIGGSGFVTHVLDGQSVSKGGGQDYASAYDGSAILVPAMIKLASTGKLYQYQPAGNVWSASSYWGFVNGAIYEDSSGKQYMYNSNNTMLYGG